MDESPKQPKKPTTALIVLGFVGVLAAVVLGRAVINGLTEPPKPQPPEIKLPSPPEAKRPRPPEEVAKPHLSKAEQECERVIEEHIKTLDVFFADSKKNTRSFAEYALGWESKGRLVLDALPFFRKDRHEKFIKGKFEEYLFKPEQLDDAVKQVVNSYITHVKNIESKMLVDLRTDTSDFPAAYMLNQLDNKRLQEIYDSALAKAANATGNRLQEEIIQEFVSTVTAALLTQVAVRLAVSAGILGAGGLGGGYTLGASVIVALIVSYAWDWYSDPEGKLVTEIDKKLDEINRLIVDGVKGVKGVDGVKGLRDRLGEFARERAATRQKAVIILLQPSSGGQQ